MNDDDFYGGQNPSVPDVPVAAPPQAAPPPPPEPLAPAQQLNLQQLLNGRAGVQIDLQNGKIDPYHAGPMLEQLNGMIGPAQQQQKAYEDWMKQQGTEEAMHAAALQQNVQLQNVQHTMQNFPNLLQKIPDPETGKTRWFGPKGMAEDFTPDTDKSNMVSAAPIATDPVGSQGTAPDDTPATPQAVLADTASGTPQPVAGSHTMTIQNGQNFERVHFQDGQAVSREVYNPSTATWGPPQAAGQSGQPAERGALMPSEHAAIGRQAVQSAQQAGLRPGTRAFAKFVTDETDTLTKRLLIARNSEASEKAHADLQVNSQQAQKDRQAAAEKARLEHTNNLRHHMDQLNKEQKGLEDAAKPAPAWAASYETKLAEAKRRHDLEHQTLHPDEPLPGGASTPAAATPAKTSVSDLRKQAETDRAKLDDLNKRAAQVRAEVARQNSPPVPPAGAPQIQTPGTMRVGDFNLP